jgi:Tfp pilus assembly protein PilX
VSIITLDAARSYITSSSETGNDAELEIARLAAESAVRRFCGRDFKLETAATARTFRPTSGHRVWVDDFYTVTGLIVATDDNDDGTAETTWAATAKWVDAVLFGTFVTAVTGGKTGDKTGGKTGGRPGGRV